MFCSLNIKVSPTECHSPPAKELNQVGFPLGHRLYATRKLPSSHQIREGRPRPSGPWRKVRCRLPKNICVIRVTTHPLLPGHRPTQVDPHYSQNQHLQILLLAKFICNPKINTHGTFTVIGRHARRSEKSEWPAAHMSSWGRTTQCYTFLCQLLSYKQASFLWFILCHIFHSFFLLCVYDFTV